MTLIKTSILSAIAQVLKIISGFVITKVIAVYAGPSGMAIIAQLQNFINIILIFAGDFLKTATTKYTAEYLEDDKRKFQLWSLSIKVIIILNILVFIFLFFYSNEISNYLLKSEDYGFVLKIFAFTLPLFILNTILLSILNGHKEIKKYIVINILLSLISLILVGILSINFGINGALVAYVTNQSVIFFITIIFVRNENWFKIKNFFFDINKDDIKKLFGFAMITLVAILSSNLSLIIIRDFITTNISIDAAGYWQGIWTLSQVSLGLITTSLSIYFLPTLSAIKVKSDISKELKSAIRVILPVAVLISFSIYILKDFIILVLYTEEFNPMKELFLWQMIGNVIKVTGWLFGYVLVSRAMIKYTVSTEIIFATIFVLLSIYLVNIYGLIGVTYSYTINNILHFFTMYYIYKYKIN